MADVCQGTKVQEDGEDVELLQREQHKLEEPSLAESRDSGVLARVRRRQQDRLPAICNLRRNLVLACSTGLQHNNLTIEVDNGGDPLPHNTTIDSPPNFASIRPLNLTIVGPTFASDLSVLFSELDFSTVQRLAIQGFEDVEFDLALLSPLTSLTELILQDNNLQRVVHLSTCNVTTIVADQPACEFPLGHQIEQLTLRNSDFTSIPPYLLQLFPNLQTLDMAGNRLNDLQPDTFHAIPRLTSLDLSNNDLTSVGDSMFAALTMLQELFLGSNAITRVDPKAFESQSSLRELQLRDNPMEHLDPQTFVPLASLRELRLRNMRLTSIDKNFFASNTRLRRVDLDQNQLTSLPANLFRGLTVLERLSLRDNMVTRMPTNLFAPLSQLSYLALDRNRIAAMGAGDFASLSNLRFLALSANPLGSLSSDIFSALTRLTNIQLHTCSLTATPASLFEANTRLQQLGLSENQLTTFQVLRPLRRLWLLDLGGNPLQVQPDITSFPGLRQLRLAGHSIPEVNIASMLSLPRLESLDLATAPHFAGRSQATIPQNALACLSRVQTESDLTPEAMEDAASCLSDEGLMAPFENVKSCFEEALATPIDPTQPIDPRQVFSCLEAKLTSEVSSLRSVDLRGVVVVLPLLQEMFGGLPFRLTSLAIGWPELREEEFAFDLVCDILLDRVAHFTLADTRYKHVDLCPGKQFDTVIMADNKELVSVKIHDHVRHLDLRGCNKLTALELPSAETLDLSFTQVTDTAQLCLRWGSKMLAYRGMTNQRLQNEGAGAALLRRCVENVDVADFAGNAWVSHLSKISNELARPIVVGKGGFLSSSRGFLASRATTPHLALLGSPVQCRLTFQQDFVRLFGFDGNRRASLPEEQLAFSFECTCSSGYRQRNGVCKPIPEPVALIASTTISGVLLMAISVYLLIQRRKRNAERAAERDKRLQALESAWRINYDDLKLLTTLGAGAYGRVMKADWDGLIVAVKELHEVVRVFDTGSEDEFQRESEFLQKTRHPNVVRFFGSGTKEDGCPFMVLEYMALGSLYDLLRPRGVLGGGSLDAWYAKWRSVACTVVDDFVVVGATGTRRTGAFSTMQLDFSSGRTSSGSGPLSLPLLQHDDTGGDVELALMSHGRQEGSRRAEQSKDGNDDTPATVWGLKLRLAKDVACGMSFIHSLGKVHRSVEDKGRKGEWKEAARGKEWRTSPHAQCSCHSRAHAGTSSLGTC